MWSFTTLPMKKAHFIIVPNKKNPMGLAMCSIRWGSRDDNFPGWSLRNKTGAGQVKPDTPSPQRIMQSRSLDFCMFWECCLRVNEQRLNQTFLPNPYL